MREVPGLLLALALVACALVYALDLGPRVPSYRWEPCYDPAPPPEPRAPAVVEKTAAGAVLVFLTDDASYFWTIQHGICDQVDPNL